MKRLAIVALAAGALGLLSQTAGAQNAATNLTARNAVKPSALSGSAALAAVNQYSGNGAAELGYKGPTNSVVAMPKQAFADARTSTGKK